MYTTGSNDRGLEGIGAITSEGLMYPLANPSPVDE